MDTNASSRDTGSGLLNFSRCGSQTVLTRSFANNPLKLFATQACACACWVYSSSLGGGLVGGDEVRLRVDVEADARALLATQASTKVYRSLRRTSHDLTASVASGALLAVVPDPVVCFAGADFVQRQHYQLGRSANLVMVDWFSSGRHASGERWAFKRYETRFHIEREGEPIFFDGVVLEHDLDTVAARMARFDVFVTAVVTGPLVSADADALLACVAETDFVRRSSLVMSAARLRDGGTLLRMAGTEVEETGRVLRKLLAFLPALLGDDPWSRKW
jgi:urease accessory protein